MKWLKSFENFSEGKVSIEDLSDCIRKGGKIFTNIVKDYPDNISDEGLRAVSVDENGVVTVEIDGNFYEVNSKDIDKIDYK